MHLILCLLVPLAALLLAPRRWRHPWKLRLPLCFMRRAVVDATLLVEPRRVTAAHLPFEATGQPRLQSGALLWASAALVTHTLANENDQAAILEAVKPLGFTPEKFLARCSIQQEALHCGQRGYIVRDGSGYRAYFLGKPADLLAACDLVWEQQERGKTQQDAPRLPQGDRLYGLAMAPVTDGTIGPMTYLGSLEITTPAMDPAVMQALLPDHWSLEVDASANPFTLAISPAPQAMNSFTADMSDWQTQLAAGFERSRHALGPRNIIALAWLILWPLLMGAFMQYVLPGSHALLLALPVAIACLCADETNRKWLIPGALALTALLWLFLQPGVIAAAFCLMAGALHGLLARLICPVECS